jgi:hypothetical protein
MRGWVRNMLVEVVISLPILITQIKVIKISAEYPSAWRLSDNSTGGSGKIVFNEYGRRKH